MAVLENTKRKLDGRSKLGLYLMNHRVNVLKTSLYDLSLDKAISYTTLGTFEHARVPNAKMIKRLAYVYEIPTSTIEELLEDK